MKKIYSLVLMAAVLLIGTNAWAARVPVSGNNRAALQQAITNAASGTTLVLQNDFVLDGPVWLGTAELNGAYKSIELDLNGNNISMTATNGNYYMFVLSHGELLVRNSNETVVSEIKLEGTTGKDAKNNKYMNTQIFTVFGSYRSSRWNEAGTAATGTAINTRAQGWFSHLEIGENVKVHASSGVLGTGIAVDELFPTEGAYAAIKALGHTINYTTNILGTTGGRGLAQGVRIDVKGDIEIPGNQVANEANKAYCIKVNGMVDQPHSTRTPFKVDGKDSKGNTVTCPFKNVDYVQNYVCENHVGDTIDVPFIYVHSSAELISDAKSTRSTAVYSSGYSKMLIEGTCKGAVGVYANSGKVEIHDAEIVSTSDSYNVPTSDGGAQGNGSAIVVNSRDNYTGSVEVTISGDSKVSATTGYAIEEIVNTTTQNTKVDNVEVKGGTIEGGNKGALIVSDATASDQNAHVTVYGGNVTGNTQVGQSGDITDILPKNDQQQATSHVTVVTDPETGKTTVVVSEGAPVAPAAKDKEAIAGNTDVVNWKHLDDEDDSAMEETLVESQSIAELEINQDYNQTLKVGDADHNVTLTVGKINLGYKAQIIVEAGSRLIVTGAQGIYAPTNSNIVLKTSQDAQAIFLFHPNVKSNRHPNATVQFVSKGYRRADNSLAWQRFGIPSFGELAEMTAEQPTAVAAFNYNIGAWENIGLVGSTLDYSKMADPFDYYQMTNNVNIANIGTLVTMKGQLYGNESPVLNVRGNSWNGFANSYMAPINGPQLLSMIPSTVQKAFYLNKIDGNQASWESVTELNILINNMKDILPMQPFLIKNTLAAADATIDYEAAVYNPIIIPSNAPARRAMADLTAAQLIVKGANGVDQIIVAEGAEFTAEFDNGYDAVKYMNDGVNMYVSANEKMSNFATDNLENTYVGFQTVNGGNYTIEFANVQGNDLTLIDHETNARIAMVNGSVYEFTAAANSVNDYRFEIVSRDNAPTAIENTEAVKSAKGIYTLTGQYVGEMNVWNTLPAGVYVVNGEKLVK